MEPLQYRSTLPDPRRAWPLQTLRNLMLLAAFLMLTPWMIVIHYALFEGGDGWSDYYRFHLIPKLVAAIENDGGQLFFSAIATVVLLFAACGTILFSGDVARKIMIACCSLVILSLSVVFVTLIMNGVIQRGISEKLGPFICIMYFVVTSAEMVCLGMVLSQSAGTRPPADPRG